MAGRVRGFETVGDMLRSLGVVGVFVAVILLITLRETPDQLQAVDPAPIASAVALAAPFAADLPGPVPAGWTPTSARVSAPSERPYSWYVGYQTDTKDFVAITQVYGDPKEYLKEIGAVGDAAGTVRINGDSWTKLDGTDGVHRALVRTDGEVTTVVVGSAPYSVLQATASALKPTPKPTPIAS